MTNSCNWILIVCKKSNDYLKFKDFMHIAKKKKKKKKKKKINK